MSSLKYIFFFLFAASSFAGNLSTLLLGSNSKVRFAGYTTLTYDGAIGGEPGFMAKCQVDYAGSRGCTDQDIINLGAEYPWSQQARVLTSRASFDVSGAAGTYPNCASWSSSSASDQGILAHTMRMTRTACSYAHKLACCY